KKRVGPGSFLGTEGDLAGEFQVSRTVVREAIGYLRGLGVVTGRQRLGLRVANGDLIGVLAKAMAPVAADKAGWPELCQLRLVIEVGSLPDAVERATAEQVERMGRLADE